MQYIYYRWLLLWISIYTTIVSWDYKNMQKGKEIYYINNYNSRIVCHGKMLSGSFFFYGIPTVSLVFSLQNWILVVGFPENVDLIWFDLIWFDLIWFDLDDVIYTKGETFFSNFRPSKFQVVNITYKYVRKD